MDTPCTHEKFDGKTRKHLSSRLVTDCKFSVSSKSSLARMLPKLHGAFIRKRLFCDALSF